jgi:hypothetical protein
MKGKTLPAFPSMNRLDAAILIIRASALYAFFQAFGYLPIYAWIVVSPHQAPGISPWSENSLFYVVPLSWFALGVFLFVRSRKMAALLLLPRDLPAEDAPPVHPIATASAAFAIIGVAAVVYALPRLLETGVRVVLIGPLHERELQFSAAQPKLLGLGAQVVLGFLLFLKSRAFATMWWRKQGSMEKA